MIDRGVEPTAAREQSEALKTLYPKLLAAGRPVQIRTFHSWFAALLRNAPLAILERLGLPASYELLENDKEAVARVWRRFHDAVAADPQARADFEASVRAHGRFSTHKALLAALDKRVEFSLADLHGVVEASVKTFGAQYPAFDPMDEPCDVLESESVRQRWLARARELAAEKNKTPQNAALAVAAAFDAQDLQARMAMLRKAFFVKDEDRLNLNLAKFSSAQQAEAELQALCAACRQHQSWLHHQRMARLARILIAQFAALKRERGWVDMNDVERAALTMLADPVLSGWVQERLDARVTQLMIDEFQDTNPLQWQALHGWLASYAGAGGGTGSASGGVPGVFIVGDPKQSIYRFRRAEPQVFRAAQEFIADGLGGDRLSCDHTRRNSPAIISAVNAVMASALEQGRYEGFREHTTASTEPGAVLRLPQIARNEAPHAGPALASEDAVDSDSVAADFWRDSLTVPRELPEEKLVTLECRQAAAWVAAQLAQGVLPQQVMVLARRRDRLAVMQEQLRLLHIPAQQPEQVDLCEAPEVMDLTALLDALVSPTHDLSLARALKSPLFGITDDELVQLALHARKARAGDRPSSWFELIQDPQLDCEPLRRAALQLLRWQGWVDRLPPHDALDAIYHDADVLARFAAATPAPLRGKVLANLRALPGAALQVDGARYATPYAFVRALKAGGIRAPASGRVDSVSLLTVHGAKGLEAPLVLMLDTDAPATRAETMGVIVEWPGEAPAPWRFAFIASESSPPACSSEAIEVEQAARQREELNGLYVAMTRARCQLVLSSVAPHIPAQDSWWQRLVPFSQAIAAPPAPDTGVAGAAATSFKLPVVPTIERPQPTSGPLVESVADALPEPAAADSAESRFGQAVHQLLERWHPGQGEWNPAQLRRLGRDFDLDPGQLGAATAMAQRILHGEGAWAWQQQAIDWSGNEVVLLHGGETLRLDRLVRRRGSGQWWVFDYKSASRPQQQPELLAQLRRYRDAVQAANPGASVHAAFLTGQGRQVEVE